MPAEGEDGRGFLAVCLNPTVQKTLVFDAFQRGEVNRAKEQYTDASGKGVNVARVLKQAGGDRVVHLTHTSQDGRDGFDALCRDDGVDVVAVKAQIKVRTCTTIVNRGPDADVTELVEEGERVPAETVEEVMAAFDTLHPRAHTVVMSGSTAPGYPADIFAEMVRRVKTADPTTCVILDIRKEPLVAALQHRPDFVKVNVKEFLETMAPEAATALRENAPLADDVLDLLAEHAATMQNASGTRAILTHGSQGAIVFKESGGALACSIVPPSPVPSGVLNTIGCGDAFAAGLALHLHSGGDVHEAVRYAQELAARNAGIMRPGRIEA
eukprot:TRINITY_DN15371_c0_g1_i1.p2 TRINITY_DN15371_c0_g1~~TRINITY_DN15371_c0_g1_i1.p2  ORF type:complete len:326 (+),score=110.94 TRINITY_DN15371_c0_g1_i1:61-1038(+)